VLVSARHASRSWEDEIMSEHIDRLRHRSGPARYTSAAVAAIVLLSAAIWVSTRLHAGPVLHDVALFAHLGFLILGFGAVLVADYVFALWMLGRTAFADAVATTSRLHALIWSGLAGLIVSGALLRPDLTSGITIVKLALVGTLTVNGVQATALSRRMNALGGTPPVRLLIWGGLTSAISQICWWGAVVIGFLNANR
jgi:hypothetical protein